MPSMEVGGVHRTYVTDEHKDVAEGRVPCAPFPMLIESYRHRDALVASSGQRCVQSASRGVTSAK